MLWCRPSWTPSKLQVFHTATVALLQLDETQGAQRVCELGLGLLPDAAELSVLLQRIQAAAAAAEATAAAEAEAAAAAAAREADQAATAASAPASSSDAGSSRTSKHKGRQGKQQASSSKGTGGSSSRASGMTDRDMKEFTQRGSASVEQVAMMNQFAAMAASVGRGGAGSGRGGSGRGRAGVQGRGRGRGREGMDQLLQWLVPDDRVPKLHEEFARAGR